MGWMAQVATKKGTSVKDRDAVRAWLFALVAIAAVAVVSSLSACGGGGGGAAAPGTTSATTPATTPAPAAPAAAASSSVASSAGSAASSAVSSSSPSSSASSVAASFSSSLSSAASFVELRTAPLPLLEQPFGTLTLVDEIDTASVAPAAQLPASVSAVQTVVGRSARTLAPGDTARYFSYRIGQGKGLVAKQAYVLDIEYPDDVARAMFVANRGADFVRGFATGTAIGDVRRTYTPATLESLAYPHSGAWKNYRSLFYLHERFSPLTAQRNAECANRSLLPTDGFDVSILVANALNDPRSNGAAVGKIRLYKVNGSASAIAAPLNYPDSLPRRHVFWREEMADEAVMGSTQAKRAVNSPIDWFTFKMDMGRALGFNTVGKDMMEWGFNQGFDSGDQTWVYNAQGLMSNIWAQIVAQAAARNLYVMPYLEYGGSLGGNCAPGNACDKTPGNYKSLGFQRRSKKLFDGIYSGDGETAKNQYTSVWWTEDKSADLTDPDTLVDIKKVMDKLIVQYKGQANFLGTWLRMRQTKLPMSFSVETIARYNAENPSATRTITQLRNDEASRTAFYDWWYGKRRAFLIAIRDHIRSGMADNSLQVHFTPYADEPVPRAYAPSPTESSTPLNLVSDDPSWWNAYSGSLSSSGDNGWYKWQWGATLPTGATTQRIHRNGLNFFRRPHNVWASNWQEIGHSTPPADPQRYQSDDGVAMSFSFGNGLHTVDDAAFLNEYNNASGATLAHHFPLNEDDGNGFENNSCNTLRPVQLADAFDAKFGYMSVAVERAGPYSVLAEARSLANGNPINIAYLESSSMSRGFPAYVRRFNQALLSLPARPMITASGMSSDVNVVVRQINTASGTYYTVINPTMATRTGVVIDFGVGTSSVDDRIAGTTLAARKLQFDLYPGEVRTFRKY